MHIRDAINCYIRDNGGGRLAVRKVFSLTCQVIRQSGFRGLLAEIRETMRLRLEQADLVWRKRIVEETARSRKITILCTQHTLYVAYYLVFSLQPEGFEVNVITEIPVNDFDNTLYIVICPQMFQRLPRAMVVFQMEQSVSDRWFSRSYLKILSRAIAILDYSKANISFLVARGIPYKNIYYMPLGRVDNYRDFLRSQGIDLARCCDKNYDVLFYGDANCPRRHSILQELGRHFRLEIVNNLFGAALYEKICAARVVINLHYYEGALLETTRIFECLSLGVRIVSESSIDVDDYPDLVQAVRFVDVGDIKGMVDALKVEINDERKEAPLASLSSPRSSTSFFPLRFLVALDLVGFDRIALLPAPLDFGSGRICLSLPETPSRRAAFVSQRLPRFTVFDGLRHQRGWSGCALSYKYLAVQAIEHKLGRLMICEDDVIIGDAAIKSLSTIESYLDQLGDNWDVFSGLIAHLHPDVKVNRVDNYHGMVFVHLDRMTSMVLNIYNHTVFSILSAWDERNVDSATNTIDRYLERQLNLRVVTTLPFIAEHSEHETSTLWGVGNSEYGGLIRSSQELLSDRVFHFQEVKRGSGHSKFS